MLNAYTDFQAIRTGDTRTTPPRDRREMPVVEFEVLPVMAERIQAGIEESQRAAFAREVATAERLGNGLDVQELAPPRGAR